MNGRAVRDRLILGLLGALLLGGGIVGLLYSYGAVGDDAAGEPFLLDAVRSFFARHEDWLWPVAAVVAVVLAVLSLLWLRSNLPMGASADDLRLRGEAARGSTRVPAGVIAEAVRDDLDAAPVVRAARVKITEWDPEPALDLRLTVDDDVDLDDLRRDVIEPAMARAREALDVHQVRACVATTLAEARRHVG